MLYTCRLYCLTHRLDILSPIIIPSNGAFKYLVIVPVKHDKPIHGCRVDLSTAHVFVCGTTAVGIRGGNKIAVVMLGNHGVRKHALAILKRGIERYQCCRVTGIHFVPEKPA